MANAVGKLALENRLALKHWKGAPKGNSMNSKNDIARENEQIVGIGQISRSVRNIAESEAWFRDVLGLDHLYTFDTLAFFDCGGTRLMLSRGEEGPGTESILYLRVTDMNAEHERLASLGVEFINAPHMVHKHDDGTEEWMAFFKDPEGRPMAIMASVTNDEST